MTRETEQTTKTSYVRRAAIAVALATVAAVGVFLLWYASNVLLLSFAAVLLAVFLRGLTRLVTNHTALSSGWAFAIVVTALVAVVGASMWALASTVAAQTDALIESLPAAFARLEAEIAQYGLGRMLLERMPNMSQMMPDREDVLSRITGVLSTTLGMVTNVVIVLFVGFYLAMTPSTYINGFLRLWPRRARPRGREVFDALDVTLTRWLLGRIILMVANGALTVLGLWLLGVPLAITLGIIAGLLNFVPNLGPIIAAIPALLIALTQSPEQVLWVALLYLVLQGLDGYVFTPLVQQQTVELPPALLILFQLLLGVVVGALGVLLATPLLAVILVLVKMLYLESVLDQDVELRGVDA